MNVNILVALSGAFAGFCYTNVAFIFDLLKVRAQFNQTRQVSYPKEIRQIYKQEGLRGFMKGYQGMLLRDAPGFAWYFSVYEFIKRSFGVADLNSNQTSKPTDRKF